MAAKFSGVINLDVRDSTPDWSPFVAISAVEFHVGDDAYVDVEKHLEAAFSRD